MVARTAVLVLAALLASCASGPRKVEHPAPAPVVAPPPSKGITFAAVGDVMLGTDYPSNILPDDDGVGFLAGVAPLLSAADVAFGNLEGVLMDGGEAVKKCRAPRKNKTAPGDESGAAAVKPLENPAPAVAAAAPEETGAGDSPRSKDAADVPPGTDEQVSTATSAEPRVTDASADKQTATALPGARGQNTASPGGANAETAAESTSAPSQPAGSPSAPAQPAPSITPGAPTNSSPAASDTTPAQQPATAGSCYVFRSPTRYATYLRDAGFDVMSLANNHAQDFGDPGRDSSMRALDDVGIKHSGRDGDIAEWTTQGRRFALVAFAPNVGSHQLNELARAREIVTDLAAHHDIVIVSFHGGSEGEGASALPFAHEIYQGEDRGDVVEFAHAVIDAGADLVLGSGPHVLRAVELYRDRLIAYSLGNFATYYGISVNGIRGIAGILTTQLADDGAFMEAKLAPTIQIRPAGPTLDPDHRAIAQLRELTTAAFPNGNLKIEDDGRIVLQH